MTTMEISSGELTTERGPYGGYMSIAYRALDSVVHAKMRRSAEHRGEILSMEQVQRSPFDIQVVRDTLEGTAGFAFGTDHLTPDEFDGLVKEIYTDIPEDAIMSIRNQRVLIRRAFVAMDPDRTRSAEAVAYYAQLDEDNVAPLEYTVGDFYADQVATNLNHQIIGLLTEATAADPSVIDKIPEHDELLNAISQLIGVAQAAGLPPTKTRKVYQAAKSKIKAAMATESKEE